jgi:hypothetical protein
MTIRFNLGDVYLRDEERRQLQKLSRELIELKAKPLPSDRKPSNPLRIVVMRKIDWGGAGQIPEALGQDRRSSSLPINRYFFAFSELSPPPTKSGKVGRTPDGKFVDRAKVGL